MNQVHKAMSEQAILCDLYKKQDKRFYYVVSALIVLGAMHIIF